MSYSFQWDYFNPCSIFCMTKTKIEILIGSTSWNSIMFSLMIRLRARRSWLCKLRDNELSPFSIALLPLIYSNNSVILQPLILSIAIKFIFKVGQLFLLVYCKWGYCLCSLTSVYHRSWIKYFQKHTILLYTISLKVGFFS